MPAEAVLQARRDRVKRAQPIPAMSTLRMRKSGSGVSSSSQPDGTGTSRRSQTQSERNLWEAPVGSASSFPRHWLHT